jgi:hypothetical protein
MSPHLDKLSDWVYQKPIKLRDFGSLYSSRDRHSGRAKPPERWKIKEYSEIGENKLEHFCGALFTVV